MSRDDNAVLAESADLLYRLTVVAQGRGLTVARVVAELESRHRSKLAVAVSRASLGPCDPYALAGLPGASPGVSVAGNLVEGF